MTNISVIINGHKEGELLLPAVSSAYEACFEIEKHYSVTIEKILILDNPDYITDAVSKTLPEDIKIYTVDFKDQGLSRNFGINQSKGKYIALLDGDDLWGFNWLLKSFEFYEKNNNGNNNLILHSEFNYFFGGVQNIFTHISQSSDKFDLELLRLKNYWDAMSFSHSEIFKKFPYSKRCADEGIALEDWEWNKRTVEAGKIHMVVPGTVHFKYRRSGSQSEEATIKKLEPNLTKLNYYDFYR